MLRLYDSGSMEFTNSSLGDNAWVVARLWQPPNRFAALSGGASALADQLRSTIGNEAADDLAVAAPLNSTGFANFSGLSIDASSNEPYSLNFFVYGEAQVRGIISDAILVSTGPAYEVALAREPGTADGGRPFRLQPALEIVDAGGNRIFTDSRTTASASIQSYASTLNASRVPVLLGTTTARATRGRIEFTDLGIDAAGLGFVLSFDSNANQVHPSNGTGMGNGSSVQLWYDGVDASRSNVTSLPLTVGVGPTARL